MKFVKGDVIASLLITLVNILGGLAIGVGQKGLDPVAALKRYGLLTIGDGLVTQIPALVIATGAGVLVTRVASEEADTPLGAELASQLFGQPQALRVGSFFVLLLALVPGLPTLPFLVIGVLLFLGSRARTKVLRSTQSARAQRATPRAHERRRYRAPLRPGRHALGPGRIQRSGALRRRRSARQRSAAPGLALGDQRGA